MGTVRTEERIGEAWGLHREGRNDEAITLFKDILYKTPDQIDALYGLGLALTSAGDAEGARESFQKALDLAKDALAAIGTQSTVQGLRHDANDLNTYGDDRYMMLIRMLQQRLDGLK